MHNNFELDSIYTKYINNIKEWLPDGLIEVDLFLLHELDLLTEHGANSMCSDLTRYFQAIESDGRLTLINDHYVIWIVPDKTNPMPTTHTLIALNKNDGIHLQLGFVNKGLYNHSRIILQVLEKFLVDIQETEETLSKFAY